MILYGCANQNVEQLLNENKPPVSACDTATVSFSAQVMPIIQMHCDLNNPSCHAASPRNWNSFAELSGAAQNGSLVNRINNSSNPMPPSGLISQARRDTIEKWVDEGICNN